MHLVPAALRKAYEVHEWRNAVGVLSTAHEREWNDIQAMLSDFQFMRSEVLQGGGSKSVIARRIDAFLNARGWVEKKFNTRIQVDETQRP